MVLDCEVAQPEALPVPREDVGVDHGLFHFATFSPGETIENPRYDRTAEKILPKLQQLLARKKRCSHRRHKAVKLVAKARRKERNQRIDFLHKESRKLVTTTT
jgi:putative transposase